MSEITDAEKSVQECVIFLKLRLKFPPTSNISIILCESMKILCMLNNSLPTSRKICDRSQNNNFSVKSDSKCTVLSFDIL